MDCKQQKPLKMSASLFPDDMELYDLLPREHNVPESMPSHEQIITFDWTPEDKFRAKLYQLDTDGRW